MTYLTWLFWRFILLMLRYYELFHNVVLKN